MSGEYAMAQVILIIEQELIYKEMEAEYLEKYEAPTKNDTDSFSQSAS